MFPRLIPAVAAMAILFGVSQISMAGGSPTATTQPTSVQGRMAKLKEALAKLDLESGQKEKIKTIFADAKTKLEALKSSAQAGTVDKTQARQILREALEKTMATLTPAQKTKLKEIIKEDRQSTTQPA